jgi:hypothetical protein
MVGSLFMLSMLFGGIDAARDLELDPIGGGDTHEMHGSLHDGADGRPDHPGDEADQHYCHCAAHAPAAVSIRLDALVPGDERIPDAILSLYRGSRAPPLLPPPIV